MSLSLFDLTGRRALVTGAGRGIGFAIAEGLARAGAQVVLNGRDQARLDAAVARLAEENLPVSGRAFDVTDKPSVEAAVAAVESKQGPIDILVNNAGIQHRSPFEDFPEEVWRDVMDTNLHGVFLMSQAVGRRMLARRAGKIINICSLMSEVGRPTVVAYTASKGAVRQLTKALCAEWAKHNIQVNGIGPGYFETELNRALIDDPAFNDFVVRRTPAGRWGKVDELQGAAIFLASEASNFVNGQVVYVDGGILAAL